MSNTAVEFPEGDYPARAVVLTSKIELRERVLSMARRLRADEPEELAEGIFLLIEGAFRTHHVFGLEGPASSLVRLTDRFVAAYLVDEP